MTKIYYVGLRLSRKESVLLNSPTKPLHTTIIYSRAWFPYKNPLLLPITAEPPFHFDLFAGLKVIRFAAPAVTARHEELKTLGATSDYSEFLPHVTVPFSVNHLPPQLTFVYEYYRTWETPPPLAPQIPSSFLDLK